MKIVVNVIIVSIMLFIVSSCKKEDAVTNRTSEGKGNENESKISSFNSSESHYPGTNCMSCHVSGGDGEGWFSIAGTVYDTSKTVVYPKATVKLYTGVGGTGTLKATIYVDKLGSFYTTEKIDFSNELYPLVEGGSTTKYMGSPVTTGSCGSCHGVSTDKLWVK